MGFICLQKGWATIYLKSTDCSAHMVSLTGEPIEGAGLALYASDRTRLAVMADFGSTQ